MGRVVLVAGDKCLSAAVCNRAAGGRTTSPPRRRIPAMVARIGSSALDRLRLQSRLRCHRSSGRILVHTKTSQEIALFRPKLIQTSPLFISVRRSAWALTLRMLSWASSTGVSATVVPAWWMRRGTASIRLAATALKRWDTAMQSMRSPRLRLLGRLLRLLHPCCHRLVRPCCHRLRPRCQ